MHGHGHHQNQEAGEGKSRQENIFLRITVIEKNLENGVCICRSIQLPITENLTTKL